MKRKLCYVILLMMLMLFTSSCSRYHYYKGKETKYYYTNLLSNEINLNNSYRCSITDTSYYKEKELSSEDLKVIPNFFSSLDEKSFMDRPKDLPKKPLYKIFITISNEKYVINVYSKDLASIYPWDGFYEMDFINMSKVPYSYNLYNICNYMIPRDKN
ncbi:DUF4883 family protein [Clostridium peptidivorans]|uniref:DUF4883 family protein n=1 Tax=Clostridium peptidivorans TaxID=100174 RepID=UPI000BE453F0|nr:DUF4883 family protein [Clostridium peptidivorans]